jgi:hypothetical protein
MNDRWTHGTRLTKNQLRKACPENVIRLALWLKIRNVDTMSHRQLIRLLDWLFKRRERRECGMI